MGMKDGGGYSILTIPKTEPLLRGLEYLPRLAASVNRLSGRKELWTSRTQDFEACVLVSGDPSPEWRQHPSVSSSQDVSRYGSMHDSLWQTFQTPCCDHPRVSAPGPTKLGPDAAALLGFSICGEQAVYDKTHEPYPERIIIYLTRGDARIRWLLIHNAGAGNDNPISREVMLRTGDCCDACALEYTASLPGRWTLIL